MKDIEIAKILLLAENNRYELACASFDVVDHINKIDMPASQKSILKNRKLAVQAMTLLSENQVKFGYDTSATATIKNDDE